LTEPIELGLTVKRSSINFIVDLAGFLDLVCLAATGFIMKYVLPAGTGGRGRELHGVGAGVHAKELWSMTRHEWGAIYFYLAVAFVILMAVHVILHWSWIKCYVKGLFARDACDEERI
jgi:hypothetical protein